MTDVTFHIHFLHSFYTSKHTPCVCVIGKVDGQFDPSVWKPRWIDGRIHSSFSDETTARCHAEMEQVAEKQAWSLSTETQVEGYLAGGLWENLTEI